jgi:hypothetical protein
MSFQELAMKHNRLIAVLATAGGLFVMGSAHAIAPAAAAGIGALAGAAVGAAAAQSTPPAVAVLPAPQVTVVPNSSTTVMGAPPVMHEVIPAPREGYRWQGGHFEMNNGVTTWVPGHWIQNDVIIYQSN